MFFLIPNICLGENSGPIDFDANWIDGFGNVPVFVVQMLAFVDFVHVIFCKNVPIKIFPFVKCSSVRTQGLFILVSIGSAALEIH
jgi:hypothetical protein